MSRRSSCSRGLEVAGRVRLGGSLRAQLFIASALASCAATEPALEPEAARPLDSGVAEAGTFEGIDGALRPGLLDAALSAVDGASEARDAASHPEPGRLAGITAAHNATRNRAPASPPLPP